MKYEVRFKKSRIIMYICGTSIMCLAGIVIGIISQEWYLAIPIMALLIYTFIELRKELKYRKLSYLKYDESRIIGYSYLSNTSIEGDIIDVDIAVVGNTLMIEIKNDVSFVLMQVVDAKEHCYRIKKLKNETP